MLNLFSTRIIAARLTPLRNQVFSRSLSVGIVGIPNVGKSTLFNALTNSKLAQASNYPFCTIEPNVGAIRVPDPNLDLIGQFIKPKRTIVTEIKLVDIAGLVRGASQNQGLGNKFLSHIRQVDAILHCVRCFNDDVVTHVEGGVNPVRDIEIINTELILSDLETVQNAIGRVSKKLKVAGDAEQRSRMTFLEACLATLSVDKPVRVLPSWSPAEERFVKEYGLLTAKDVVFIGNVDENQIQKHIADPQSDPHIKALEEYAKGNNAEAVLVSAKTEAELFEMSNEEKMELLSSLGMKEPALATVARKAYDILGLQSFYTAGEQEVRAWKITKGTLAPQAAGTIHSDIEKGFIRAETYCIKDLVEHGSVDKIKASGKMRSEGKDYVLKPDDVVNFLFNVSKSKK